MQPLGAITRYTLAAPPINVQQVPRPDVPAKPALVVGLEQANSARRQKRATAAPPPPGPPPRPQTAPPPLPPAARSKGPTQPPPRAKGPSQPPPRSKGPTQPPPRRPLPSPFNETTRAVQDDELLAALRAAPGPGRTTFDEPTRLGDVDARMLDRSFASAVPGQTIDHAIDDLVTHPGGEGAPKFLPSTTELSAAPPEHFDELADEKTRMANVSSIKPGERSNRGQPPAREERTRAVDIRNDPSISDIDWDLD